MAAGAHAAHRSPREAPASGGVGTLQRQFDTHKVDLKEGQATLLGWAAHVDKAIAECSERLKKETSNEQLPVLHSRLIACKAMIEKFQSLFVPSNEDRLESEVRLIAKHGKIEAMGHFAIHEYASKVISLVTNPKNIYTLSGTSEGQVRGGGTALMELAILESKQAGHEGEIHLEAKNKEAYEQYLKWRFKPTTKVGATISDVPMALAPEDADVFLKEHARLKTPPELAKHR